MNEVHGFSFGQFTWWMGVVEEHDTDPLKIGRVRVRIFGYHSQDKGLVPTETLPFAMVAMPPNSASVGGIGASPTGLLVGSTVWGFFADGGDAQTPIVVGTFPGAPGGVPDTAPLVRGEQLEESIVEKKNATLLESNAAEVAMSGLSLLDAAKGKLDEVKGKVDQATNGLQEKMGAIKGMADKVQGIKGTLDAIKQGVGDVKALKAQVEGQIADAKAQIERLKNLDPKQIASDALYSATGLRVPTDGFSGIDTDDLKDQLKSGLEDALLPGISGDIEALKNLDFGSIDGALDSLLSGADALGNLQDKLANIGNIGQMIDKVKGLAGGIPNAGAIMGLVQQSALANAWKEPASPAAPEYPKNHVVQTEGGHVEELDDTPGAERYQRYHPAGSFIEVHPDGTQVEKVVKDGYSVTMGDKFIHVEGNVKVNIIGDSSIVVNGNATMTVSGNKTDIVSGDYTLAVGGDVAITSGGSFTESAASKFGVKAPRIDLN